MLVFGAPCIQSEEIRSVVQSLRSGWIGTGRKVAQFEEQFRLYKNASYAVAVASCSAALHLSLLALGLQPGDEVITSAMTFCATVNGIIHAGLTPVLADIDPDSNNIDPADVERRITTRTRAIVPVHFAGRACNMEQLCAIADRHGLRMVEDCAHAIETEYHGRPAGTFGDFGCFSFYVTKNVVTAEGGMILAANQVDAARIKTLALHGLNADAWTRFNDTGYRHYDVVDCGFKYNMTDIQAAIGIPQLQRVERNRLRREQIWNRYTEAFADLPVTLPAPPEPRTRHAYHLYTLLIDQEAAGLDRDAFLDAMISRNIGIGVHYRSIPEHGFYRMRFNWNPDEWPVSRSVGRRTVSIPLSAGLSDRDVDDVIHAVQAILSQARKTTARNA